MKINEYLISFLEKEDRKVMILKGPWGIGKTYEWQNFISKNKDKLKQKSYSYVSLFGVNSIDKLNKLILSGSEILNEDNVRGFFSKMLKLPITELITKHSALEDIAGVVEGMLLKNYLICFDDIERRSKSFQLADFLGYVSVLVEQKDCKVVIILNEEELEDKDFEKYREKIVDMEIKYIPTIGDNYRKIFGSESMYLDIFQQLNVNNIRVMKKANLAINDFAQEMSTLDSQIISKFNKQLVYYTSFYYDTSNPVKKIEKVHDYNPLVHSKDKELEFQNMFLRNTHFWPSDYDSIIVFFLKNGFYNADELREKKQLWCKDLEKIEIDEKLQNLWGKYNASFCSQDEFIAKAKQFLKEYSQKIGFQQLETLVDFIKKFDKTFDAYAYKEKYIAEKIENSSIEKLSSFKEKLSKGDVLNTLVEEINKKQNKYTLCELVNKIIDHKGFSTKHFLIMNNFTEKDIMAWIKSNDKNLFGKISFLLKYSVMEINSNKEYPNGSAGKEVYDKIKACLDKIEKIDEFNKRRIQRCIYQNKYGEV
ncbi:hypothetical protein [Candidatus Uabimicrobium sp. HlEnr_7]|uniref:hypothetical protein n=1 Tax=Candidatus Uabimicrobium helgolandensis TaxID=3095367 RepID=UPI0035576EF2